MQYKYQMKRNTMYTKRDINTYINLISLCFSNNRHPWYKI